MSSEQLDRTKLERLLLTDDLFVDTFNIFLGLPVFGIRIFFNKPARSFEEHVPIKHSPKLATIVDTNAVYTEDGMLDTVDGKQSFIRVLNPTNCLDIFDELRLHLFNKSELYLQYLLAKELLRRSGHKVVIGRKDVTEFISHLKGSIGYNIYCCWMDIMRASRNVMNMSFNKEFLGYLRRIYFTPSASQYIPSLQHPYVNGRCSYTQMGELIKADLMDSLVDYWTCRFKAHILFVNGDVAPVFLTEELEDLYNEDDLIVRVPMEWRRYKLPSRYQNNHNVSEFFTDRRDLLLRAISLEKTSGGYLWEHITQQNSSLGIQRCLILLYFVQLWLEFSVPATTEKRRVPHYHLTDYIYFSSVHLAGDQWIGCPPDVRSAVASLWRKRTGNLNTFKPAVDFSLAYLLRPFLLAFESDVNAIINGIRIDGELRREPSPVREIHYNKMYAAENIIESACRELLALKDPTRRGILNLLEHEEWLSDIFSGGYV